MLRAPLQVVVIPFHTSSWSGVEYCLHQCDDGTWEAIVCANDGLESPAETARRATCGVGIVPEAPLYQLQSMDTIPVGVRERERWATDRYAIPRYTFGVDVGELEVVPADEGGERVWMNYPAAHAALGQRSLQNALWELHERIHCHDLRYPAPAGRPRPARVTDPG
ncbi:MAG: hypothetical protein WCA46_31160 [Actinocatenispora sp.]